jgi:hypothetical protein
MLNPSDMAALTPTEAVRILRFSIKQLSAAAACAQIDMQRMKQCGQRGRPHDDSPLFALDDLATQLAAPALAALDVIEGSTGTLAPAPQMPQ